MNKEIARYQRLPEDFYEIICRRELKLSEVALAIYLRGKSCRFKNPFYLNNQTICMELNITEKVLCKYRKLLQKKGVIKFDVGNGKGHHTIYTMLDTIMVPQRVSKQDSKGAQTVTLSRPNGNPSIYKNKERIKNKNKTERFSSYPKNFKKDTFKLIR